MNQLQANRMIMWAHNVKTLKKSQFEMDVDVAEISTDGGLLATMASVAGWLPWIFSGSWELVFGEHWVYPKLRYAPIDYNEEAVCTEDITKFFGINEEDAYHIIDPNSYTLDDPTPIQVSNRILRIANKYGYVPS